MILIPCYLLLDLGLCRGGRRCKSTWPSSWLPSRCCNYTFVHWKIIRRSQSALKAQSEEAVTKTMESFGFLVESNGVETANIKI
ncbi:hypothetical protein BDA96_06G045500 [Sorghum bicolor]|uniref:Uncharacterized protein n=1 Tax=Sorghum bicolor TaxID=4558 RepID=A0A921QP27_SORBI|nr:hypothetical protein BDA96_06G045500 [Sorghum bicolor]